MEVAGEVTTKLPELNIDELIENNFVLLEPGKIGRRHLQHGSILHEPASTAAGMLEGLDKYLSITLLEKLVKLEGIFVRMCHRILYCCFKMLAQLMLRLSFLSNLAVAVPKLSTLFLQLMINI